MRTAASISLLFLAAVQPPSPQILPVLTAAVRAGPQSASPSPTVVRRMLGAAFADAKRIADRDAEWLRYDSTDGTCKVELGPIVDGRVLKLTASCLFHSRGVAIDFLHEMVNATKEDWQPPVFYTADGEMAYVGAIMKKTPIGAEAYLQHQAGDAWRAAVVLSAGGRAVTPVSTPSSKPSPRSRRTSF